MMMSIFKTDKYSKAKKTIKTLLVNIERRVSKGNNNVNNKKSEIYISENGTPQANVQKILDMMGGVNRYIGCNDLVILKPNAQWWNQGRTNLAAMKGFIDAVLNIPGFNGEVILAENHHFMDESLSEQEMDNIRGWVHLSEINGDIDGVNHNINSLIALYQDQGIKNVTKSHWRDGGPKKESWGNGQKGGVMSSPAQGDGYIWSDEDYIFKGLWGWKNWKVKMSYPVFTSTFSGITIDLKNGAYQRDGNGGGRYLENTPVKLINFSVLNDHGGDTGITGAIKNYMGITDLSCGWWGSKPDGYANVHSCGEGYYGFAKAGPLGHFMKTIRKADLNIVTAEWVGWGSRTDPRKAAHLRTIIAGTDPVALDYYGAKHFILPLSKNKKHHDPDSKESSIARFLELAQKSYSEGAIHEESIKVYKMDLRKKL